MPARPQSYDTEAANLGLKNVRALLTQQTGNATSLSQVVPGGHAASL